MVSGDKNLGCAGEWEGERVDQQAFRILSIAGNAR